MKEKKKYEQTFVNFLSDDIARDLSNRAGITIKDCKYIIRMVNEILFDRLASGESIRFRGVGNINIRNIGPSKIYSPVINHGEGGFIEKDDFYKFSFSPSTVLKEMLYYKN